MFTRGEWNDDTAPGAEYFYLKNLDLLVRVIRVRIFSRKMQGV